MSLIQHEPIKLLSRMQSDLNDFFKINGRRLVPELFDDSEKSTATQWLPSVDIKDSTKKIVITADVPGVDPKDIQVSLDNGYLSIRGERKSESEEKSENHSIRECSYGFFERRFALPSNADADKINAKEKHGVLTVTIAKKKGEKPREVDIQT